jgi:aliphatic nitrilase
MHAVEGQTFVVAPCSVVGQAGQDLWCDTEQKRQLLLKGGGFTRIHRPEGSELALPLAEDEEGILYADLDFSLIAIAKSAADPVGHYSRPDVFQLRFNPRPNRVVVSDEGPDKRPRVDVTEPSDLVPVDESPLERV